MNYKIESNVSLHTLKETSITDEYIFRQMVMKLIKDVPLNVLQHYFAMTKIDPSSYESRQILALRCPGYEKIRMLQEKQEALYLVEFIP